MAVRFTRKRIRAKPQSRKERKWARVAFKRRPVAELEQTILLQKGILLRFRSPFALCGFA